MQDPIFPPEIEYIIFLNAFDSIEINDRSSVCSLVLVAQRVYEWLIPQIMQTIVIRSPPPSQKYPFDWNINTLKKHGSHVKDMFIWISTMRNNDIQGGYLSLCPNITNLLLWTAAEFDDALTDILTALPIRWLSVNVNNFRKTSPAVIQLFSGITHLDSLNMIDISAKDSKIKYFTSLTHLSVPQPGLGNPYLPLFERIPTLKVLILLKSSSLTAVVGAFDPEMDDPRVVKMTFKGESEAQDWLLDSRGERGLWGLADEAVRNQHWLKAAVNGEGTSFVVEGLIRGIIKM